MLRHHAAHDESVPKTMKWAPQPGVAFHCFFFQAEDGIRDLTVTGVQTCALPISRSGEPGTLDGHRRGRRRYRARRQSGWEVSHRHAAPGRRRRALGRIPGHRASIAPLLHLALGQYRPPAHPGHGGARGPRRHHRVDPDPPPAPAQPAGRTPQGLDSDCGGTRADAHIVTESNATGTRRGLFLTLSALLFAASAAGTILWSRAMAEELRWPALAPAMPIARGVVLVAAGCVQLTPWKARHLTCCREGRPGAARPGAGAAWRRGISLGVDCVLCCVPFMTLLVVTGMMNLAMIALTALAITVERVAREPALVVRLAGLLVIGAGALEIVRAAV